MFVFNDISYISMITTEIIMIALQAARRSPEQPWRLPPLISNDGELAGGHCGDHDDHCGHRGDCGDHGDHRGDCGDHGDRRAIVVIMVTTGVIVVIMTILVATGVIVATMVTTAQLW